MIYLHPLIWLWTMTAHAVKTGDYENVWILLSVTCTPLWFVLTRYLAEIPGYKHGKMHFWWFLFAVFHVAGFLIYGIVDITSEKVIRKSRLIKRLSFEDRHPKDILDS